MKIENPFCLGDVVSIHHFKGFFLVVRIEGVLCYLSPCNKQGEIINYDVSLVARCFRCAFVR